MSSFKYIFLFAVILLCSYSPLVSAPDLESQSIKIKSIIENEENVNTSREIIDIIQTMDDIYSDLYEKLKDGKKIVIFVDPAHGLLPDGRWQGGAATRRQSCTDKPEEYYSTIIARELYKKLKANPHIEVKSTPDFLDVMKGNSENYKNISFPETIILAKKANAFMIVSEHLNNVSVVDKASGILNIPGIHITRSLYGERILKLVTGSHKGFLTLYNKFDASGFSKEYATNIRDSLVKKGIKPNRWDEGVVGDDRFTYFSDYPISVIYESGFISHPDEEKLLGSQEYAAVLADSQYKALLKTIEDVFKVDISGRSPKKRSSDNEAVDSTVELIKLSQIAVHYIKKADTDKAASVINMMESSSSYNNIAYFKTIRAKIVQSESYYAKGVAASKNKNKVAKNNSKKGKKKAKPVNPNVYYSQAYNSLNAIPVFKAYKNKYAKVMNRRSTGTVASTPSPQKAYSPQTIVYATKAPKLRTILLPIEDGKDLKQAIEAALSPDKATLEKLHASFQKSNFTNGIYLVTINNKLTVTKKQKVKSVTLNPNKYQNQQYLKNSFFAPNIVEKSI